jgi:hypothetical protein
VMINRANSRMFFTHYHNYTSLLEKVKGRFLAP